jgi:hypothetical protein
MPLTHGIPNRRFPEKIRPTVSSTAVLEQRVSTKEIMKRLLHVVSLAALGFTVACTSRPSQKSAAHPPPVKFAATPARITTINEAMRFVVLDFTNRTMPPVGTVLSVYRGDLRIGTVKITEPVRANFATADIIDGSPQVGDEAR